MASNIGRNTPTADIKLSPAGGGSQVSYRAQFSAFTIRSVVPQIDVSTFADEPATKYEAGETIFVASMAGLLQTGSGAWMAFFPPPQAVSATFYYTSTCTVGGTWNFAEVVASRPTNGVALISGNAQSTGAVVIAWA